MSNQNQLTHRERAFISGTILTPLWDAAHRAVNARVKLDDFIKMAENVYLESDIVYYEAENDDILEANKEKENV